MENNSIDRIDREILRFLQVDATMAVSELSERVGLTTTPCWRRIQALEKRGVIKGRVALLDGDKLDLQLTVFVQVKAGRHDASWLENFAKQTSAMPEVVECYRMSGEYDYMLKVLVHDMAAFDVFYKGLVSSADMSDVTSSFSMEQIKYTTALPIK